MIPGLLLITLCSVPVFYFGNLCKQYSYCMQVVRINKDIGDFDIDELFEGRGAEEENRPDGGD